MQRWSIVTRLQVKHPKSYTHPTSSYNYRKRRLDCSPGSRRKGRRWAALGPPRRLPQEKQKKRSAFPHLKIRELWEESELGEGGDVCAVQMSEPHRRFELASRDAQLAVQLAALTWLRVRGPTPAARYPTRIHIRARESQRT